MRSKNVSSLHNLNSSGLCWRYLGATLFVLFSLFGLLFAPRAYADGQTGTTTTLTLSASAVTAGDVVTFTAAVKNTSGLTPVTRGMVMFCDASATYCTDIAVVGTAQLTSAGTAVIKRIPGIGVHSYKAVFVPTTTKLSSSSGLQALTVSSMYDVTATISSAGSPGNYTLTGTVAGINSLVLAPTGSVSFLDTTNNYYLLGSRTLGGATRTAALANQVTKSTGSYPQAVGVGDFDNDGNLDLVVANYGAAGISRFTNAGDGTFSPKTDYSTGTNPMGIAVKDFDGDGKLDVVVANYNDGTVSFLKGNGDGTFQSQTTTSTGTSSNPAAIASGDFRADGNQDLAVVDYTNGQVGILLGNGNGTFGSVTNHPTGTHPRGIAVGDFDADEKLELAVTNFDSNTVSWLASNGDGTFRTKVDYQTGSHPYGIVIADFNQDGHLDMAVANNGSNNVGIFLGNGNGTFQSMVVYPVGLSPQGIAIGDFNADGKVDLVVTNSSGGTVSVLIGNGDGTFKTKVDQNAGTTPRGVATGDFSNDGITDVAVANYGDNKVGVLLGQVTQTAAAVMTGVSVPGSGSAHLVIASYPGDSNFKAKQSSEVSLSSTQVSTTLTLSATPTLSTYGQSVVLTATLSPSTAGDLTTSGETVTFKNGAATIGAGTLDSLGVATLTLSNLPSGTDSLTAVYTGDSNFVGSTSSPYSFVVTATRFLTVTAMNATRLYGAANPTFTYVISGFVDPDTQAVVRGTPSLTTTATGVSPDGSYPIVASLGTLAADSYGFRFVNATLSIYSAGSQAPDIHGRWEFAVTSGDMPSQLSLMGQSSFSTYLVQTPGTGSDTLSIISPFTTHTVLCDGNGWLSIVLSGSSIDSNGNVSITFTDTQGDLSTFQYVFTGTYLQGQSGAPSLISGTYQRSAGGCTQGSLGTGTPDGNFVATFFPDMGGRYEGAFEEPNEGPGGADEVDVPATFVLTTNLDKTLGGTVSSPTLKSSGGVACFNGPVVLQPGMPEGVSYQAGEGFELYGIAPNGARLWVNAYATNNTGLLTDNFLPAAVGEDGLTFPAYGPNDGTNNAYIAFYGITGGPCDGLGGGDAPFQLVKNNHGWAKNKHAQKAHPRAPQRVAHKWPRHSIKPQANAFGEQKSARKP